jgi:hypothetical protein
MLYPAYRCFTKTRKRKNYNHTSEPAVDVKELICAKCGKICIRIPLTKGYHAVIRKEDLEKIKDRSWYALFSSRNGRKEKSRSPHFSGGYSNGKYRKASSLHSFILEKPICDHIDKNPANNCRCNLREATVQQNNYNRGKIRAGTPSKFIGVTAVKRKKGYAYAAHVVYNKKQVYFKTFELEEDAARARDIAALKYFGEFANLNFPLEAEQKILR